MARKVRQSRQLPAHRQVLVRLPEDAVQFLNDQMRRYGGFSLAAEVVRSVKLRMEREAGNAAA